MRGCAEGKPAAFAIGEDALGFRLVEQVNRAERLLTAAQLKEKERDPWKFRHPEYDFTHSGRLTLLLEQIYSSGLQRTWGGGAKTTLESLLPRAVEGVMAGIAAVRARREEREREHAEREEHERQRVEKAMEQFQEDRREAIVARRVKCARMARETREWADAIEKSGPIDPGGEL